MEANRIEISALPRASHKKSDIAKRLNVSRMTVHRVASCLRDGETLKDRPRSGRPRVVNTKTIRKSFENDPTLKMTHLARKKKISVSTVRRAVKIEMGKNLKRAKKPLLTAAMKQKRFERCNHILNDLKNHGDRIVIFSDEMTFTVDSVMNKQNDRIVSFGQNISELQIVSKTKTSGLCDDAWNRGIEWRKMPPVWFPGGYRLTTAAYKDVLVTKVVLWVRKITRNAN